MKIKLAVSAFVVLFSSFSQAVPVNGTGLVSPEVIFGSGNANGSWTGDSGGAIEVALRAKLRYDLNGNPQNVFNYDGDRVYTFDPALSNAPAGQSVFNFEFAVNSDTPNTLNRNVNDIVWLLAVDSDPSANVFNVFEADPINVAFADHSFGNDSTANGAGVEAAAGDVAGYDLLVVSNNVAQNSFNFGSQAPGIYTFSLSGSNALGVLASTSIDVIVLPTAVAEPSALGLLGLGLLGLVFRWQRRLRPG